MNSTFYDILNSEITTMLYLQPPDLVKVTMSIQIKYSYMNYTISFFNRKNQKKKKDFQNKNKKTIKNGSSIALCTHEFN